MPGFHMIITVIVSTCRRLIGDTSPICRSRSPKDAIIWKPGLIVAGLQCTVKALLSPRGAYLGGLNREGAY